ncbi:hypothetical protein BH10BAC1_BH10BAC1_20300 [soil metagenome]
MKVSPKKYLQDALYYAKRGVELNPNNGENLYTYSQILFITTDYTKSSDYYYKAIAIKPSLKDVAIEKKFEQ